MGIGDLMAGVVAILIVLFLASAWRASVERSQNEKNLQQEKDSCKAAEKARKEHDFSTKMKDEARKEEIASREAALEKMLKDIAIDVAAEGQGDRINVNVEEHVIRISEATFRSGKTCISDEPKALLRRWGQRVRPHLENDRSLRIQIEGHSDANPLHKERRDECGVANDNYSLSAIRARNARDELIKGWRKSKQEDTHLLENRVDVTGLAASHPLKDLAPTDGRNRRVEIRFKMERYEPPEGD